MARTACGSIGVAGSFSFQNSKVMTAGEGGILTTNDAGVAERARALANGGRRADGGWFHHYTLGTNYRITALQAAVLVAQLERLPEQNCRRERYASIVRDALIHMPGLTFRKSTAEARVQTNYLLLGRIDSRKFGKTRDEFHRAMTTEGVPCTAFYPHTLYGNPLYQRGGAEWSGVL